MGIAHAIQAVTQRLCFVGMGRGAALRNTQSGVVGRNQSCFADLLGLPAQMGQTVLEGA